MAKYLIEDISLTSIADVIREKASASDSLSFPFGFISAINSIEQTDAKIKIGSGTLSFTSDYSVSSGNGTEVKHNLGVVPDMIIIYSTSIISDVIHLSYYFGVRKSSIFNPDGKYITSVQSTGSSGANNISVSIYDNNNDFTSNNGQCVKSANDISFYFAPITNMAAKGGQEYVWYAIGMNNI